MWHSKFSLIHQSHLFWNQQFAVRHNGKIRLDGDMESDNSQNYQLIGPISVGKHAADLGGRKATHPLRGGCCHISRMVMEVLLVFWKTGDR
jgi:hypothetical protein